MDEHDGIAAQRFVYDSTKEILGIMLTLPQKQRLQALLQQRFNEEIDAYHDASTSLRRAIETEIRNFFSGS